MTILQPPTPGAESSTAEWANYLYWARIVSDEERHAQKLAMDQKMLDAQLAMVEASKTAGDGLDVADVVALIQAIAGAVKP